MTELMTQAAAVAVTAALCAAVVRRGTPEIALVLERYYDRRYHKNERYTL